MDYSKICFVIMPFGTKAVGAKPVNFDSIYDGVFAPAISAAPLPEGGNLVPKRTDKDFFSGLISQEMFQYIEYSRFALADISGLNANVFYELGARHRARESGTAIFRQVEAPIPFDINQIKALPYEYEPDDKAKQARELITRVLTESLQQNRLDSPIQAALRAQRTSPQQIDGLLQKAEDAIRNQDRPAAISILRQAAQAQPDNPLLHFKLGLLMKDEGQWTDALGSFVTAIQHQADYAEAWRERGIAENKLYWKKTPPAGLTGEDSLGKAVELNPRDFDALASLGGVFKRQGRLSESADAYRRATEVSNGHPYPLLNEIKLRSHKEGKLMLDATRKFQLVRAERSLRVQVQNAPPYNAPWSYFDLAEIRLYQGDTDGFLNLLAEGALNCSHSWQPKTFRDSLKLLVEGNVQIPGLNDGIQRLDEAIQALPD